MKAICGLIMLDGAAADPGQVAMMRAMLQGRGIAEEQAWNDGAAALAGVTWWPASDGVSDPTIYAHAESGCAIVADALLFERAELLAALDLPQSRLHAIGDAELILRAYLRWGEDCAARLHGDFAFVIHDQRNRRVHAARDGMGVRPLYFHHVPGKSFAFASNVGAVTALPQVPRDLDDSRLADYLVAIEGNNPTSTFFRSVRRLLPAHWCSVDAGGCREACYWIPGDDPVAMLPAGDDAWAEAVRAELERAVRRHLSGRAGIGSMISGGLDSSTVAAMAAGMLMEEGRPSLPVFSAIDSANPDCAETRAIRSMLARPGLSPHIADIADIDPLRADLMQAIAACEEPFDGHMTMVQTQFILAARAGVGAVLDGLDADTLFSEGHHMMRLLQSGCWMQAWRDASGLAPFYGGFPAWKQIAWAAPVAFAPRWLKTATRPLRKRRQLRTSMGSTLIARDFAQRAFNDSLPIKGRPVDTMDALLRERCESLRSTSLTAGLERYRRVASMHGIEPRHPFLDRRLIALCIHLPDRQRARDGWTKAVLREAARPYLPGDVCWRRGKEHLGARFSQAVFDHQREANLGNLWDRRSVLEPRVDMERLAAAIDRYRQGGDGDEADLVFGAAHLQEWMLRQRGAGESPSR